MADPAAEQQRPEAEEAPETRVKPITATDVMDVPDMMKFDDIDDNVGEVTKGKHEIISENSMGRVATGECSTHFGQVVEEETVELKIGKVKPKLATYSMHCPNCKSQITKVILRWKMFLYGLAKHEPVVAPHVYVNHESVISSEQVQVCKYDIGSLELQETQQPETLHVNRRSIINYHQVQAPKYVTETAAVTHGTVQMLSMDLPECSNATGDDDDMIMIENEPGVVQSRRRSWLGYEGVLAEISKSIVYGGLMEVIVSLGVVASAAASGATTLCIVSLALASLIGRVFIIGHNLWDLRDYCYKYNQSQTTKYNELLGQVNYFPLHTFFAILSFLVFGMVPPVTYKYSYHETKDRDFTLLVVATASILCVILLAILKAYINKCTISQYFKMVVYYIIIAVSVSSVSYVVGNLVMRLMKESGWFSTSSGGAMPCLPHATSPYLEAF
ncbi:hypothetical protein QVD17_34091 [Tagetes erecta]|uniref:Membrane protein of ER body-like protein n=1 Tax=Tagetes erecta TaxID=13708 RepID=A0AAD8JZ18_TARER|nr:hypothetical protein QVD17_34091 [Tagetes erecta]